jgi:ATP-dependent HslUV protease ATP-binding subunit HslU
MPAGTTVSVTAEMVREKVADLAKKADLAKFIL